MSKVKEAKEQLDVEERLEERLARLIRMFGSKNKNNGYTLGVSTMHLIINGNFCEEFEDVDNAPCIVNYVAVDSDDITPWFNMQATTGMVGLVWGDKYSIGAMGQSNVKKIIDYVESKYGTTTKDKKKLMELRRTDWLKIAKDNNDVFLVGSYTNDKTKEPKGCDFGHAVDCIYCCYDRSDSKDLGLSLNELKNNILSSIDKTAAFFLRVQYPTRESLKKSYYLAGQDGERWARWNHIIPLVNKKIFRMIKPHEVKELIAADPSEVLVNGRLKGDEVKKVRVIVKPKKEDKEKKKKCVSFPERYLGDRAWNDMDWDARHKAMDAKKKSYEQKVKTIGHPRFEIVISPNYKPYYDLQIKGIVWMFAFNPDDRDKAKYPEHARFYNGTKETSIPVEGTTVIDHFDKNKTPYLLGDLINLGDRQDDPCDGFFYRMTDEHIVKFDFLRKSDIDKRDWHGDRYSQEAQRIHDVISTPKRKNRKLVVSERTGMSYAQMGYHARITGETVKSLWTAFNDEFQADEQRILDHFMKNFDHEAFALKLQQTSSPLESDDLKVVPKYYRREYHDYITNKTGYRNAYDIPRDRLLSAQRGWWTSIYRDVLQNAMRVGREDTLDYAFLKDNRDVIPCEFDKIGYYYLTPDKNLDKSELDTAEKVRLVVNALLNKKNKPAKPAL